MRLSKILSFISLAYSVYFIVFALLILDNLMHKLIFFAFSSLVLIKAVYDYMNSSSNVDNVFAKFDQLIQRRRVVTLQYLSDLTNLETRKASALFEYYLNMRKIDYIKKKSGGYVKYVIK